MTHITFFKNSEKEITGFYSAGHAGYAESGSDIICSAISVLTINTINSIEAFTDDQLMRMKELLSLRWLCLLVRKLRFYLSHMN
jgi:uncharacterized protein YsxB (DUF464 family)